MAGRNFTRGGGPDPGRDDARREHERLERARKRSDRAASEAEQQAARSTRATDADAGRDWSDGEWSTPAKATRDQAAEAYAAPATRAGRERQRAFAPLAPATPAAPKAAATSPAPVTTTAPAAAAAVEEPEAASIFDPEPFGEIPDFAARESRGQPQARAKRDREPRAKRERGAAAPAAGFLATVLTALAAVPSALAVVVAFISARRVAAGAAALVALIVGVFVATSGGSKSASTVSKTVSARKAAEARWAKSRYGVPTNVSLPPTTRIVAYAGAPHAQALGILGTVSFKKAASKLKNQSVPYARPTRRVLRAYDLIATIASSAPGPAGKYRTRQPASVIERYLRAARRDHATLILDIQPGQSNFVDELRPLERWLREPDVQLALDPEWRMRPGVVPGSEIGYVSGGELQATLNRVAAIIKARYLPPKMVLVHRFTDGMIKNFGAVKVPKGIVGVISIDGVGSRANKEATYNRIAPTLPKPWLPGFKLFYQEDQKAGGVMSGKQVMGLTPRPHVVLYE